MSCKQQGFFITGTDTDIGKTYICQKMLHNYNQQGYKTIGLKPVSSGGNSDALILQQAASIKLPIEAVNPFAFIPPIAPHIATKAAGVVLTVDNIYQKIQPLLAQTYDYLIMEGVGGWQVPLNDHETVMDLAKNINFPVILVVGIKLGCINHALLTADSIMGSGVEFAGWIANCLDNKMLEKQANIDYLQNKIVAPMLAIVDYLDGL
jgi:dethiobiotin synthetase